MKSPFIYFHHTMPSRITRDTLQYYNPSTFVKRQKLRIIEDSKPIRIETPAGEPEIDFKKDPWLYDINSSGFRGEEIENNTSGIACFGCSVTFGVGVETPMSNVLGAVNMGIPGAAIPLVCKSFVAYTNLYECKHAFITLPDHGRMYFPTFRYNGQPTWFHRTFIPQFCKKEETREWEASMELGTTGSSMSYMFDYIDMVVNQAKITGTKVYWASWSAETSMLLMQLFSHTKVENNYFYTWDTEFKGTDYGRDGLHPGPKYHGRWAQAASDILHQSSGSQS
jgi:hypothetical protein